MFSETEMKVVIAGTVEDVDLSNRKVLFNNKGIKLEFWMVTEELYNITKGQETEVTLVISNRDGDFFLSGYIQKDAYDFVMQFTSVPGIGRKTAEAICYCLRLKGMSRKDICFEISNGNTSLLTEVPGVGPRAARAIVEGMKDKIQTFETVETFDASTEGTGKHSEVIKELEALGFMKTDISKALSEISIDDQMETTGIVQAVIKKIQQM